MEAKTHWKKVVSDPNYLGEADFGDKEEKVLTIANVVQHEKVMTKDEPKGKDKVVVHWAEQGVKPLIMNVTNAKAISKVVGSDYLEDWVGHKVQLYIEHGVKAFGDIVNAVRVRPYKPKISTEPAPKCEICGKDITPAHGMDAASLAKYTFGKYGKKICAECATDLSKVSNGETK